jgi:hypothetical protein
MERKTEETKAQIRQEATLITVDIPDADFTPNPGRAFFFGKLTAGNEYGFRLYCHGSNNPPDRFGEHAG